MHTPLTPTHQNGHGHRYHSPARPNDKHCHSDTPTHGLRAQLHNLLPRHSFFHAHIHIHQISSVPLVHGEFAARWKFKNVQSQTGLLKRVKGKRRGSQKAEKGKAKEVVGDDSFGSAEAAADRHSSSFNSIVDDQNVNISAVVVSGYMSSTSPHPKSPYQELLNPPIARIESYSNTRGMTPFYKLKNHAIVWDHDPDVIIKMDIDRETSELLPKEFKLVLMQRVIPGDPDAPRNPRLGSLYLDLNEYAGVGKEVTRTYFLRDTKMNAAVKLTICLKHSGVDTNYIAPLLPKADIFNGVADLLNDDVYITRPRELDLWGRYHNQQQLEMDLLPRTGIPELQNAAAEKSSNGKNSTRFAEDMNSDEDFYIDEDDSDIEESRYEVPSDVSRLPFAYGPKTTEMLIEAIFNPQVREEQARKLERVRDKDRTGPAPYLDNESPSLYSADDKNSHSGYTENSEGRGRSGMRGCWSSKKKTPAAVSSTPTGLSRPATPGTTVAVLQSSVVDAAQRDVDGLREKPERKDVELDEALQDRERSSKDLEQQVERLQEELTQIKQERDHLCLASSKTSSSREAEELKHRLEDAERENRDLINVISRLKQDGSQGGDEINTLHSNFKEARAEHQQLESKFREIRATETPTRSFKLVSLTQQLQLAQSEVERVNIELTTNLNDMTQNHNSLQANLKALQTSLASQTHQLTQELTIVQHVNDQIAKQEATYSTKTNSLHRLVEVSEAREKQAKDFVENMERDWTELSERADEREANVKADIEKERRAREEAENKIEQLEKVLDKIGWGELPIPGRGAARTPSRRTSGVFDEVHDRLVSLSPTIAMVSKTQKSIKNFTEVYAHYVQLQDLYEKKNMDVAMENILAQLEERAPVLSQQRIEYERIQSEASQLASKLAQAISDRDVQYQAAHDNLDDLGLQVRALLKEIGRPDDRNLSSDEDLENVIAAEVVEDVITNNLILFRSIDKVQLQNQSLRRIVRGMGAKMEQAEKKQKAKMEEEQAEAVREAHEPMENLVAELDRQKKHSDNVIQAYVKERDALKAIIARSNHNEGHTDIPTDSSEICVSDVSSSVAKELAGIQNNIATHGEIEQLQAALAKASTKNQNQIVFYRTPSNASRSNRPSEPKAEYLTKRNQQLLDNVLVLTLMSVPNLRAKKGIWESIQSRLDQENKSLALERSHLSTSMSNVQRMHRELERSGETDRCRLENQLQLTQELRNQVTQEREAVRNLSLQKDIEVRDLQNRLNKSAQELSKTREALAVVEISKDHLEERVGNLTKHMKDNEEKLAQLECEVAGLRSVLKVVEFELTKQKDITHEEYIASTDAQFAKSESDRCVLEERLQIVQTDLGELTTKHNDLQKQYKDDRVVWSNDEKTLEDTIVNLSTSENDRNSHENAIKQQEERAKVVEERCSNEVLSHAESIKALDNLKKQLASVQTTVRDYEVAAVPNSLPQKAAGNNKNKRLTTRRKICDNGEFNDLTKQNNILHHHLETVSSQAAYIRQAAETTTSTSNEADANDSSDVNLSEMRFVIAYIRKEKEIQNLNETRQTLSEILPESNATSRADGEARVNRIKELETKLDLLVNQLEPTKEEARVTKTELQDRDTQMKRLEEKNRRWQGRNQQLLTKMQALKDKIERLKVEECSSENVIKEREDELNQTKSRVEKLENTLATYKKTYAKNMNNFKSKLGELNAVRSKLTTEKKELEEKVSALEGRTHNLEVTLDSLKPEKESSGSPSALPDGAANPDGICLSS
ncbi:uncharacterized protein C8R40DRAFT_1169810 [Lentinula edodes]|uniref:uncharacterized protein n=1 Tax=Lentinula edodes TaxID=5353 RepID=UPI001E8E4ED2|nr:uncharacterized protein C8R40DRAFT_1169810 [Lentinula edodes]KAH7876156.1 hypothetical protein C8R40DRAFT_1169810 [Lentinula edodes]